MVKVAPFAKLLVHYLGPGEGPPIGTDQSRNAVGVHVEVTQYSPVDLVGKENEKTSGLQLSGLSLFGHFVVNA